MWNSDAWKDYILIDAGDGERLESWDGQVLVRPDPQALWHSERDNPLWQKPGGRYIRSSSGGGRWEISSLPKQWRINYKDLTFKVSPMNFKHTGVFPEQAVNWDWAAELVRKAPRKISVLNLFAYTGCSTLSLLAAGAEVCHVDAARGMVQWARENAALSGLESRPVRWIVDDCAAFVNREIRRGRRYDAIIMDPPSYGRGPSGEVWKLEEQLYDLVSLCVGVLSDNPLFMLINSYSTGLSPSVCGYMLGITAQKKYGGKIYCDEIGLPVKDTGLILPCGSSARWET